MLAGRAEKYLWLKISQFFRPQPTNYGSTNQLGDKIARWCTSCASEDDQNATFDHSKKGPGKQRHEYCSGDHECLHEYVYGAIPQYEVCLIISSINSEVVSASLEKLIRYVLFGYSHTPFTHFIVIILYKDCRMKTLHSCNYELDNSKIFVSLSNSNRV